MFCLKRDIFKSIMAEHEQKKLLQPMAVTSNHLRVAAADAELRGDWDQVQLLNSAADRLIQLEGQNQAYRHALSNGVSINLVSKRRWFHVRHG